LGLKNTATVSWFEPKNQVGFGLLVAPQNRWREDGVGHTLRFGGLLHLQAGRTKVFQSGLNTDEGVTTGDERGTIVEFMSGSS
jgi:hypothetical protein